jgi:uncharacterized protein YjiS (DUF1127 family)
MTSHLFPRSGCSTLTSRTTAHAGTLVRHSLAPTAAHRCAEALAHLAAIGRTFAQQWSRRQTRTRTERALRAAGPEALRDLGLTPGEVSSIAREVSGEIEATRERAWREISRHIG